MEEEERTGSTGVGRFSRPVAEGFLLGWFANVKMLPSTTQIMATANQRSIP
jgi:hypothetical protein